jgi:hypothetical protein
MTAVVIVIVIITIIIIIIIITIVVIIITIITIIVTSGQLTFAKSTVGEAKRTVNARVFACNTRTLGVTLSSIHHTHMLSRLAFAKGTVGEANSAVRSCIASYRKMSEISSEKISSVNLTTRNHHNTPIRTDGPSMLRTSTCQAGFSLPYKPRVCALPQWWSANTNRPRGLFSPLHAYKGVCALPRCWSVDVPHPRKECVPSLALAPVVVRRGGSHRSRSRGYLVKKSTRLERLKTDDSPRIADVHRPTLRMTTTPVK